MTARGPLDGLTGVAKIDGEIVAEITLHDERVPRMVEVQMAGDPGIGIKPLGTTGAVMIRFDQFAGDGGYGETTPAAQALREELRRRASKERYQYDPVLDLVLNNEVEIAGCRVGGSFRSVTGKQGAWFGLELPE